MRAPPRSPKSTAHATRNTQHATRNRQHACAHRTTYARLSSWACRRRSPCGTWLGCPLSSAATQRDVCQSPLDSPRAAVRVLRMPVTGR